MGKHGQSAQLIPRWSVKRTRTGRASQGANSQSCLPVARLLEPEGSQQAQLATQGVNLPSLAHQEGTDGTEMPSTPASRKFEALFVPDSPEEGWSGGKGSSRHRRPCNLTRTTPVSSNFEEFVVPDSPEETWGASACTVSRTPLASTNFEEFVVPDSPEETYTSKDPSQRPCKLRRTTSLGKFHQHKPVDDGNNAALEINCSELLSPTRTGKRSEKLSFEDAADSLASDHLQHVDNRFPVLPAAKKTSSIISDQPPAIDFNGDLDHQASEFGRAPDEIQTCGVRDELPTSFSALNFSAANGKPLAESSTVLCSAPSTPEDEELDNCSPNKSQGIIVREEEFHRGSPTPYVPDTEEDAGAPVTPFSTTSKMLASSSPVLEKLRAFDGEESVEVIGICGRAGAGVQKILDRNVKTQAPATPFPIAIGKAASNPTEKARGDGFDDAENCRMFVRAGLARNFSGDVQDSETGNEDAIPPSFFVTGSGKPVPVCPTAFRKVRALLEVEGTETGAEFSGAEYQGTVHRDFRTSSKTLDTDDALPLTSASSAMEKTTSTVRDVVRNPIPNSIGGPVPINALVTGIRIPEGAVSSRSSPGLCNPGGNPTATIMDNAFPSKKAEILLGHRAQNHSTPGRLTQSAFSTASGGRISVSSSAMQKAREVLGDEEVENGDRSTVLGLDPSAKPGHEKGKAPFGDDDKENHVNFERNSIYLKMHQLSRSSEFATDRNGKLRPLSEIQACSILQSADKGEKGGSGKGSCSSQGVQNEKIPEGSSSFRRRSLRRTNSISEESLQAANDYLARPGGRTRNDFGAVGEQKVFDPYGSFTFKTGSGKTVAISREAMEKAKALLDNGIETSASRRESVECHATDLATPTKIASRAHPFRTPSVSNFTISSEATSRATTLLARVKVVEDPLVISSFVTGSGKSLSISSKSLEKARAVLGEQFEEPDPVTGLDDPVAITSFATRSGKSVSISSNALEKARAVLGEVFEEPAPVKGLGDPVAITFFTTGSGESVSISSKALEKARAVLGEEFEEPAPVKGLDDPVAITSFATGSGKSVSISSKALEKARAVWGKEFEEPAPVKGLDDPVAITSFATGSGKSVSISSKALEKARAVLGEAV
ncbi:unnamed protein product [Calypogeia fissa]